VALAALMSMSSRFAQCCEKCTDRHVS